MSSPLHSMFKKTMHNFISLLTPCFSHTDMEKSISPPFFKKPVFECKPTLPSLQKSPSRAAPQTAQRTYLSLYASPVLGHTLNKIYLKITLEFSLDYLVEPKNLSFSLYNLFPCLKELHNKSAFIFYFDIIIDLHIGVRNTIEKAHVQITQLPQ